MSSSGEGGGFTSGFFLPAPVKSGGGGCVGAAFGFFGFLAFFAAGGGAGGGGGGGESGIRFTKTKRPGT